MNRRVIISLLAIGLFSAVNSRSQADPDREQADRYRDTRIAELQDALQSIQKRINSLREENGKLRDEIDRLKNKGENAATQESIKRLGEKIEEVDKKRQADNEKTVKALKELEKLILERPSRPPTKEPGANVRPPPDAGKTGPDSRPPGGKEVGWEYAIQDKDTLSGIVAKLRTQEGLKKLTQKQVMDANPSVNWNKLKPGSKIFIPAPTTQ